MTIKLPERPVGTIQSISAKQTAPSRLDRVLYGETSRRIAVGGIAVSAALLGVDQAVDFIPSYTEATLAGVAVVGLERLFIEFAHSE